MCFGGHAKGHGLDDDVFYASRMGDHLFIIFCLMSFRCARAQSGDDHFFTMFSPFSGPENGEKMIKNGPPHPPRQPQTILLQFVHHFSCEYIVKK
jgi:hypothetical protein